jgi:dTMP kinase
MSGKLIVFEGGDAAGKATQANLLKDRLISEGREVEMMSFPDYDHNQVGSLIRDWLHGDRGEYMNVDPRVSSVLFAADRFESKPVFESWLDEGKVVILDRYTTANVLHQGAKEPHLDDRAATMRWIHRLEHEIFNLPIPDLVMYLDMPANLRIGLMQKQWAEEGRHADVAEMDDRHQAMVDDIAEELLGIYPKHYRLFASNDGQVRSREDIHEEVYNFVRGILEK